MRNPKLCVAALCLLCALPGWSRAATDTYTTVLIHSTGTIAIDGDLSDWDGIEAPVQPLNTWLRIGDRQDPFGQANFNGPEDLSASFRAFVDDEALYVAVEVTDDVVVFQREAYGRPWWDDAVHLYLANGSVLEITRGQDGDLIMEGRLSLRGLNMAGAYLCPYLWEAVGVRASLKERQDGYTVEVRIPQDILNVAVAQTGMKIPLNVAVSDHDVLQRRDNMLGWSATGGPSAAGVLVIGAEQRLSGAESTPISSKLLAKVHKDNDGNLIVSLTESVSDRLFSIYELENITVETARKRLNALKAQSASTRELVPAGGVLFYLLVKEGNYLAALSTLDEIDQISSTPTVSEWCSLWRKGLSISLAAMSEHAADPNAEINRWEQIYQYAVKTSNDALIGSALKVLVKLYDKQSNQGKADALRRQSIDFCTELIRRNPTGSLGLEAIRTRLLYRLQLGEDIQGKQEIDAILATLAPTSQQMGDILNGIAATYCDGENYEQAIATYQKVLGLTTGEHTQIQAQYGLGTTYLKMNDLPEAIQQLQSTLQQATTYDDRDTLFRTCLKLSLAYKRLGDFTRSRTYRQRAQTYLTSPFLTPRTKKKPCPDCP